MNIDARNLNLNNITANNPKITNTSENKFEELMRNLNKSDGGIYICQNSLASLTNQTASRTDTYSQNNDYFDVSQIKIVRLKEHYERDYTIYTHQFKVTDSKI